MDQETFRSTLGDQDRARTSRLEALRERVSEAEVRVRVIKQRLHTIQFEYQAAQAQYQILMDELDLMRQGQLSLED